MEIKTCEQYVLRELEHEKEKNEILESSLNALMTSKNEAEKVLLALSKVLEAGEYKSSLTGEKTFISFRGNIWAYKEEEDYLLIKNFLKENGILSEEVEEV